MKSCISGKYTMKPTVFIHEDVRFLVQAEISAQISMIERCTTPTVDPHTFHTATQIHMCGSALQRNNLATGWIVIHCLQKFISTPRY